MTQSLQQPLHTTVRLTTVECQHCGCHNTIAEHDASCKCMACGERFNVALSQSMTEAAREDMRIEFSSIATASNYVDLKLEETDWHAFAKNETAYTLPDVDAMLEPLKVKFGDQPDTWRLCFRYLHHTVTQKIAHLDATLDDIIKRFVEGVRKSDCRNEYDALKTGIDWVVMSAKGICDKLDHYKNFAHRFGADTVVVETMRDQLLMLRSTLSTLKMAARLDDFPRVAKAQAAVQKSIADRYSEQGIDAETVLHDAQTAYTEKRYTDAYAALLKIPDYLGAQALITTINQIVTLTIPSNNDTDATVLKIHDQFYWVDHGALYPFKHRLIDLEHPIIDQLYTPLGLAGDAYVHYAPSHGLLVRHALKTLPASLKNPPKKNKTVVANNVTLDRYYGAMVAVHNHKWVQRAGHYVFEITHPKEHKKNRQATFKQRFKTPFKKFDPFNTLDVFEVDVIAFKPQLLVANIHRFLGLMDDKLYYEVQLSQRKWYQWRRRLTGSDVYCLDLTTQNQHRLPIGQASLHDISTRGELIYTRKISAGNNNLFLITPEGNETMLDNNIFEYAGLIENKVFYTVGSLKMKSLCTIDLVTRTYEEVLKYMERILFEQEGWLYILHINENNHQTLYRQAVHAKKLELVAFGLRDAEKFVDAAYRKRHIVDGYIYYTNYDNVLCKVRLNGTGYKELVYDVETIITVVGEQIFYVAIDTVEHEGKQYNVKSFYKMVNDGSRRSKVLDKFYSFSVVDDRSLLLSQEIYESSKAVYYDKITDEKLHVHIKKMYDKLKKKDRDTSCDSFAVYHYFYASDTYEYVACGIAYPQLDSLKNELKERLK